MTEEKELVSCVFLAEALLRAKEFSMLKWLVGRLGNTFADRSEDWLRLLVGATDESWDSACDVARAMLIGGEQ